MADDDAARAELVRFARRLEADGLAVGTAGNLSVRLGDRLLITPGGVPSDQQTADTLAETGLDGHHRTGRRPSSELRCRWCPTFASAATSSLTASAGRCPAGERCCWATTAL